MVCLQSRYSVHWLSTIDWLTGSLKLRSLILKALAILWNLLRTIWSRMILFSFTEAVHMMLLFHHISSLIKYERSLLDCGFSTCWRSIDVAVLADYIMMNQLSDGIILLLARLSPWRKLHDVLLYYCTTVCWLLCYYVFDSVMNNKAGFFLLKKKTYIGYPASLLIFNNILSKYALQITVQWLLENY